MQTEPPARNSGSRATSTAADPVRDPGRLDALRRTHLLDTEPEESFDRLTRLASRFLQAPLALVNLVDEDRQFSKSCFAPPEWPPEREALLEESFCKYAIVSRGPVVIEEARDDARVSSSRLVRELGIRSYLGVPLVTSSGHALGTLCVADFQARSWSAEELEVLRDLAAGVTTEIELREDVARREEIQARLAESESQYRLLFERNPNPMWLIEPWSLHFLAVNDAAVNHYGFSREEFLAMTALDVRPPEDVPASRELLRSLPSEYRELGVVRHRAKDGRILEMLAATHEIPFQGRPARIVAITDVTVRRRAEAALQAAHDRLEEEVRERTAELQQSEQRFRAMVEHGQEIITILAVDGTIRYKSPAAERELGYAPDELVERNIFEFVHPDDRPHVAEVFSSVIEEAAPRSVEFRFRHRGGSYRTLQATGTSLLGERAVAGVVVNSRDLTELRRNEDWLRQAQRMEAVGNLASGVAHDFNNLLMVIGTTADLLLMDVAGDGPIHEDVEEIKRAASRAAALTRQLLAFSRKQVLQPEVIDLNAVVSNFRKILTRTLPEDIEFTTLLAPGLGRVRADPGQIEQVLANLVINARDAMPGGGTLVTETANVELGEGFADVSGQELRPGRYALLAVSDTGHGMPAEVREHIFEPFFTTKEVGKGTGLGLSTVYGIVKQSGGHIWVYSEEGRGTTFKIYLPQVDEETAPAPEAAPRAEAVPGTGTILLVEDEPAVRRVTRRTLERSGYTVLEASNGEEALHVLQAHEESIALVLTDMIMPRMSGKELAARLAVLRPGIRVLFASGYTDAAIVQQGILEGGVRFLQKPYSPDRLVQVVAEVLSAE